MVERLRVKDEIRSRYFENDLSIGRARKKNFEIFIWLKLQAEIVY
jgi:hypothetical protein